MIVTTVSSEKVDLYRIQNGEEIINEYQISYNQG